MLLMLDHGFYAILKFIFHSIFASHITLFSVSVLFILVVNIMKILRPF